MDLKKVILICGAPHSGSTLLGLILGSHSKCFYAGEANKTRFINNNNSTGSSEDKACKVCGKNCPIWGSFSLNEHENLYQYLAKKSNRPVIIDSTKNIKWLKKQIGMLKDLKLDIYLIYLSRDGRAVINSRIRKYKDLNVADIIKDWKEHIIKTNSLYNNFADKKIKVKYEDLATNSEEIIQKICFFLNLKYEPKMLNYYEYEHHPLGGNTGTQSLLQNLEEGKSLIQLSERNQYYYQTHPLGIKLDLRWKEELSLEAQNQFKKIAGNLNKEFAWDDIN
jgi:hypothetical protein